MVPGGLMITVNFHANTPLYRQLYDAIKHAILDGTIAAHEKLPSKRNLAQHLNISQNTVMAAYLQLQDEGYLYSKERQGYFVHPVNHQVVTKTMQHDIAPQDIPQPYRFDFSAHAVDPHSFPAPLWGRLTRDVLSAHPEEMAIVGDHRGHEKLRTAIAHYLLDNRNLHVHPEQVIIRSGVESLLPILLQILPGKRHFGLEDPGYERIASALQRERLPFSLLPLDDKGLIVPSDPNINVLYTTPSHQFPTGVVMPVGRRQELLNWCEARDGYLLEDDYDSEFKYQGHPIPPLKSLDKTGRVIYLGSFSKCLSPALRISYMVLPPAFIEAYETSQDLTSPTVPTLTQLVLAQFMAKGHFERHINRMRHRYRKRREVMVKTLASWPVPHTVSGADAGLHLLVTLTPSPNPQQLDAKLKEAGIHLQMIAPSPSSLTLLLGFGAMDETQIQEGLALILKILQHL